TLGGLGAAVLAFHEGNAAPRSWWRGFALFGWGYLVLAMGPWASEAIAPHLPTTMGLDALYARMHPDSAAKEDVTVANARLRWAIVTRTPAGATGPQPRRVTLRTWVAPASPESFHRVGHCLWALMVACAGGVLGRAFQATGEQARPTLDGHPLTTP
ncbi:MAG TPA: hypothetical protein VG406_07420, partial [Isosphaeraceae bacterium]|nr:hypothetical protein [Isosphaeraceae bacterium]